MNCPKCHGHMESHAHASADLKALVVLWLCPACLFRCYRTEVNHHRMFVETQSIKKYLENQDEGRDA